MIIISIINDFTVLPWICSRLNMYFSLVSEEWDVQQQLSIWNVWLNNDAQMSFSCCDTVKK